MGDIFQSIRLSKLQDYYSLIRDLDVNVVNSEGFSLLQHAIAYENNEVALDLVKRGIDVNYQDRVGQTSLHFCGAYKNSIVAKAILDNGGEVNIVDLHGNNPLWTAAFNARGDYDVVKILITYGADANSKNKYGRSPFDFANQIGDDDLDALLRLSV